MVGIIFLEYVKYLASVTGGGEASGSEHAKYSRYNKSRGKNEKGEHLWVIFRCGSCVGGCSSEVRFILLCYALVF